MVLYIPSCLRSTFRFFPKISTQDNFIAPPLHFQTFEINVFVLYRVLDGHISSFFSVLLRFVQIPIRSAGSKINVTRRLFQTPVCSVWKKIVHIPRLFQIVYSHRFNFSEIYTPSPVYPHPLILDSRVHLKYNHIGEFNQVKQNLYKYKNIYKIYTRPLIVVYIAVF